jgi:hypothetical protein
MAKGDVLLETNDEMVTTCSNQVTKGDMQEANDVKFCDDT